MLARGLIGVSKSKRFWRASGIVGEKTWELLRTYCFSGCANALEPRPGGGSLTTAGEEERRACGKESGATSVSAGATTRNEEEPQARKRRKNNQFREAVLSARTRGDPAGAQLASAKDCDEEERRGAGRERDDEELKPREDDERNGAERLE